MKRPVPPAKIESATLGAEPRGWNGVRPRLLLLALLAILAAPVASQEDAVYFSLNSSRTYAPGEKPTVQLWASGVDSLEFRVYRVKDPVAFFQQLEDVHRFGGQAPALPRERTWLERFHSFKRGWRYRIRNLFRYQFSDHNRTLIRHFFTDREPPPARSGVTTYAQVPLLNQQQVVAVWRQALPQVSRWNSLTVPIEVSDKGLYLVEAVHGELRAYTIVLVTGMAVVTKTAPGRTLSYVVDRQTGAPLEGATVRVWSKKEEINRQASDAQGLVDTRFEELRPEDNLVLAQRGDDFAVDSLYAWNLNRDPEHNLTAYLYTERPVYRPGHTVHWKGILRTQVGADYAVPERRQGQLQVLDPEGKAVFQETVTVSPLGTINGKFALPATAALGYYSLELHLGAAVERAGFHVEEYRKPEYEVKVIPTPPARVLQGQPIQATIQARYYFGEPVANARVTYVVHRSTYGYYRYYDEEEEGDGEDYSGYYAGEQIIEETGQLDTEGRLAISIPTEVVSRHYDMRYRIEARVTDPGNREISGVGWALATYGSFRVTIDAGQYVYEAGQRGSFTVEAKDYDGNPVQTRVQVELFAWRWDEREERRRPITSLSATTGPDGKARVQLPLGSGGSFYARATARTPEGREVEGRDYVWVTGPGASWWGARRERLQIIPDKKTYAPGETARLLIITGTPDANVLVTTEGRELFTHQVVKATGPTVTVDVLIRPEYAPNFYVGAVFLRENQLYQGSKSVT
ncbi:MAG: MG2 domain-containing protein, partial [Candidatus Acidiferrales bacterium]